MFIFQTFFLICDLSFLFLPPLPSLIPHFLSLLCSFTLRQSLSMESPQLHKLATLLPQSLKVS